VLKNFVVDADLKKHYPTLASYLPPAHADFSVAIGESFNLVLDEMVAKGFEPRKLMLPIDLGRAATETADENVLMSISATGAVTKTHVNGIAGFRRCVLVTTAWTGNTVVVWEGSNDQGVTDTTEPTNWTTIKQWTLTATGIVSHVTDEEFKYYRVRVVSVAAGTTTFTASIYETYCDRWIMWKAFVIVFQSMSKSPDDIWSERARSAQINYDNALQAYKVMVDEDDNNIPDETTTTVQTEFTL
jgi:hypothetical protein